MLLLVLILAGNRATENGDPLEAERYERSPLPERDFVFYTVQPGDTLSMIERKFRTSSRETVLALNPDVDPDRLPAGKRMKIPLQ